MTRNDVRLTSLISKIRGEYLRNEFRYDKWGAQGKILVAQKVLTVEGIILSFPSLRWLVNLAFPRTFACCKPAHADSTPVRYLSLTRYFTSMRSMFFAHGMGPRPSDSMALEETAEKFCMPPGQVRILLHAEFAG